MTQIEAGETRRQDKVAMMARGLLLALATPSVAALVLDSGSRTAATLRMIADIFTLPAFFAIAGWMLARPIASAQIGRFLRAVAPAAACGALAALVAATAAPLAGLDWRSALSQSAPAWSVALLPAAFALLARAFGGPSVAFIALAIAAHVAGVILSQAPLVELIYFAGGLLLASRRDSLFRLVDEEPEFAIASGPFVAVLATAVAIRFGQTGQPASIAALGPVALALGLAAGPATLASIAALRAPGASEAFARLGRAAPAIATFWLPLFFTLIASANRGAAPSISGAFLMSIASLLAISVAADVLLDLTEKRAVGRAEAHS